MKRPIFCMALIFYSNLFSSGIGPNMDMVRSKSLLMDDAKEIWLLDAGAFKTLTDVQLAQACSFAYHNEKLRTALPEIIKQITTHRLLVKLSLILSQLYNGNNKEWQYYWLMEDTCTVQDALNGNEYAIGYLIARNKKAESILKNYDKDVDQTGLVFDLLVKLLRSSLEKTSVQTKNRKKKKIVKKKNHEKEIELFEGEKRSYKKARIINE